MAVSKTVDVGSNPACPGFNCLLVLFFHVHAKKMRIPRTKYRFRFLVRLDWSGNLLKLNKFGPILNQLAIEDSSKLDETISYFYENQSWPEALPLTVFGRAEIIIWKRQSPHSLLILKPINLDSILKLWLQDWNITEFLKSLTTFGYHYNYFDRKAVMLSKLALLLSSLKNVYWSPEFSYRLNLVFATTTFKQIAGTLHTYKKRKQMLGRKVNFRRKLKAKTFEEY